MTQTPRKNKTTRLHLHQGKIKEWADVAPVDLHKSMVSIMDLDWGYEVVDDGLCHLTSLAGANKHLVTKLEKFNVPCNLNSRSSRSLTVFCRIESPG